MTGRTMIEFYTERLGVDVEVQRPPAFAEVSPPRPES